MKYIYIEKIPLTHVPGSNIPAHEVWFEYFEERLLPELTESARVFVSDYYSTGTVTTLKGFVEDNGKLLKSNKNKKKSKQKKMKYQFSVNLRFHSQIERITQYLGCLLTYKCYWILLTKLDIIQYPSSGNC